ncbi:hypothetical protein, partial [Roseateles sp. P5_E11]
MNPIPPEAGKPTTETGQQQQWRRGVNGYALTIAVIVHLILLAAVLMWRTRVPPPEKPRITDVSIV